MAGACAWIGITILFLLGLATFPYLNVFSSFPLSSSYGLGLSSGLDLPFSKHVREKAEQLKEKKQRKLDELKGTNGLSGIGSGQTDPQVEASSSSSKFKITENERTGQTSDGGTFRVVQNSHTSSSSTSGGGPGLDQDEKMKRFADEIQQAMRSPSSGTVSGLDRPYQGPGRGSPFGNPSLGSIQVSKVSTGESPKWKSPEELEAMMKEEIKAFQAESDARDQQLKQTAERRMAQMKADSDARAAAFMREASNFRSQGVPINPMIAPPTGSYGFSFKN